MPPGSPIGWATPKAWDIADPLGAPGSDLEKDYDSFRDKARDKWNTGRDKKDRDPLGIDTYGVDSLGSDTDIAGLAVDDHGLPGLGMGSVGDDLKDQKQSLVGDPLGVFKAGADVSSTDCHWIGSHSAGKTTYTPNADGSVHVSGMIYEELACVNRSGHFTKTEDKYFNYDIPAPTLPAPGEGTNPKTPNPQDETYPGTKADLRAAFNSPGRLGLSYRWGGPVDGPDMSGTDPHKPEVGGLNVNARRDPGFIDPMPDDENQTRNGARLGGAPPASENPSKGATDGPGMT